MGIHRLREVDHGRLPVPHQDVERREIAMNPLAGEPKLDLVHQGGVDIDRLRPGQRHVLQLRSRAILVAEVFHQHPMAIHRQRLRHPRPGLVKHLHGVVLMVDPGMLDRGDTALRPLGHGTFQPPVGHPARLRATRAIERHAHRAPAEIHRIVLEGSSATAAVNLHRQPFVPGMGFGQATEDGAFLAAADQVLDGAYPTVGKEDLGDIGFGDRHGIPSL